MSKPCDLNTLLAPNMEIMGAELHGHRMCLEILCTTRNAQKLIVVNITKAVLRMLRNGDEAAAEMVRHEIAQGARMAFS